jgi:hypothetical protein
MARLTQFLAIILTALALVPSGAHLAVLPNKIAMAQAAYFVAQQIYTGWALFGIFLFGALAANLAHTIVLRRLGRSFGYERAHHAVAAVAAGDDFVRPLPDRVADPRLDVVVELREPTVAAATRF